MAASRQQNLAATYRRSSEKQRLDRAAVGEGLRDDAEVEELGRWRGLEQIGREEGRRSPRRTTEGREGAALGARVQQLLLSAARSRRGTWPPELRTRGGVGRAGRGGRQGAGAASPWFGATRKKRGGGSRERGGSSEGDGIGLSEGRCRRCVGTRGDSIGAGALDRLGLPAGARLGLGLGPAREDGRPRLLGSFSLSL